MMVRARTLNKTEEQYERIRERSRKWREDNRERGHRINRKSELKRKYGLTYEEYEKMVEDQGGRCFLCGEEGQLVVDHCHEKLKVRKLLCRLCNTGLGMFKDNPKVLKKAAKYVEQ